MGVAVKRPVDKGSKKQPEGFTLIELMVVLAVMGVLVSAALPSMSDGLADRRVAMVTRDVVSLFQRARYMSMAYGRAHQVVYASDSGLGLGEQPYAFETRRGTSGSCSLTVFENGSFTLADLNCDDADNWRCVDHLYGHDYDADPTDDDQIRVDGYPNLTFCYEAGSNNQVFKEAALFSNWQDANAQAGFGFVVYRARNGNPVGVARKVLIPLGTGSPRVMR